jgi:hypothetical protein
LLIVKMLIEGLRQRGSEGRQAEGEDQQSQGGGLKAGGA